MKCFLEIVLLKLRLRRAYPIAYPGQTLMLYSGEGEKEYHVERVTKNTITFSVIGE